MVSGSKEAPAARLAGWASKKRRQGALPPAAMRASSPALKASMVMERTNDTCTPRPRCTPEQVRQMKMPNLGDAWGEDWGC